MVLIIGNRNDEGIRSMKVRIGSVEPITSWIDCHGTICGIGGNQSKCHRIDHPCRWRLNRLVTLPSSSKVPLKSPK